MRAFVVVAAVAMAVAAATQVQAGPLPKAGMGVAPVDPPPVWVDGPEGGGTGAVLAATPNGSAVVNATDSGVTLTSVEGGDQWRTLDCVALGAPSAAGTAGPAGHDAIVPATIGRGTGRVLVRLGPGGACGGAPALVLAELPLAIPATLPAQPREEWRVTGTLPLPGGIRAVAVHPSGRWAVVAHDELAQRRGRATILDLTGPHAPVAVAELSLANGVATDDLVFSDQGDRLYATAASHAVVFDTEGFDVASPTAPERLGTLADPLVRNYWRLDTWTVDDALLGHRELFVVRSRIDGLDCPTGMVHVYDITDELFWEPAMVIDVDVPDPLTSMRSNGELHGCGGPVLRMQSASRTVTIGFGDGRLPVIDRLRDQATRTMAGVVPAGRLPYDTTEAFRATLPRCTLVAA